MRRRTRRQLKRASVAVAIGSALYAFAQNETVRRIRGIRITLELAPLPSAERAALPPGSGDAADTTALLEPVPVPGAEPPDGAREPAYFGIERRRIISWTVAAVVLAIAGYLAATRWPHPAGPTLETLGAPVTSTAVTLEPATSLSLSPVTTAPPAATHRTTTRAHAQTRAATTRAQKPVPATTRRAATRPATTRRTSTTASFVPARSWVWPEAPGVTAYDVVFYRGGAPVYRATVHAPRIEIPPSFKFTPGRYRWTVQASAPKSGKLLVDSSFVLSPAAAAAANQTENP
jgi:hypothetical protein